MSKIELLPSKSLTMLEMLQLCYHYLTGHAMLSYVKYCPPVRKQRNHWGRWISVQLNRYEM
jgi:predicted metal-dependent peptidase